MSLDRVYPLLGLSTAAGLPEDPLLRCVAEAARAETLGAAFTVGYQAALQRLVPGSTAGARRSLCATEARGAHPRHIEARLEAGVGGLRLTGEKSFATLAGAAEALLVLCAAGEVSGRKALRLVRVAVPTPGLRLSPGPALPFCPEVDHATVRLDEVPVADADVLPGDGWVDYVKPFRSVEDLTVGLCATAALTGLLLRRGDRADEVPPLLALLAALVALAELPLAALLEPGPLLALDGALRLLSTLAPSAQRRLALLDPALGAAWERDLPLLSVAARARAARAEGAWSAWGGAPG